MLDRLHAGGFDPERLGSPKAERAPPDVNGQRFLGRWGLLMAKLQLARGADRPAEERRIKVYGETLVVSRGAQLRPVGHYLHLVERAKIERLAREERSKLERETQTPES